MILITGAAGFLGRNLLERLYNEQNIVIIDKNKAKMKEIPHKNKIIDDINNISLYIKELRDIDTIYHLAAIPDMRKSLIDTRIDLDNNIIGTYNILELMRKSDIKNLIFTSSTAVYGESSIIPTPENVIDTRQISLYGASKLSNESYIQTYCYLYGIKSWIFRLSNVIGKYQHRGLIVDIYNKLKIDNKKLEILGNGSQLKSYFSVEDFLNGITKIPKIDGNKRVEIYNLGNNHATTVNNMVGYICDYMNVRPEYKFIGGEVGWSGDTKCTFASIDRAKSVGWKPKYSTKEAVNITLDYLSGSI